MTDAWLVLTFIVPMIADNVMWETRFSIDWVYSETQLLLDTLKTLNPLREESDVSLEVEHSFP